MHIYNLKYINVSLTKTLYKTIKYEMTIYLCLTDKNAARQARVSKIKQN